MAAKDVYKFRGVEITKEMYERALDKILLRDIAQAKEQLKQAK